MLQFRILGPANGTVTVPANRGLVNLDDGSANVNKTAARSVSTVARIGLFIPLGDGDGRQTGYLVGLEGEVYIALDDVVGDSYVPVPPQTVTVDPNPELQAALAAATEDIEAIREIVNT